VPCARHLLQSPTISDQPLRITLLFVPLCRPMILLRQRHNQNHSKLAYLPPMWSVTKCQPLCFLFE